MAGRELSNRPYKGVNNIGIISGPDGPTEIFVSSSNLLESVIFLVAVALLLVHEMDAIRAKEWRLFVFLRDLPEETAYRVFALIHLPLFFVVLFLLIFCGATTVFVTKLVVDVFLIAHAILHYCFRKKENNDFSSRYSKILIYSMALLAVVHLFFA